MNYKLTNLEPRKPWQFFEEISVIPRGSGNEKGISEYLRAFAKERGLEVLVDPSYNVVIKKNGQGGGEKSLPVALQGHTDMVCEKNASSNHDFLKDPIDYYVDGDLIRARGTTLGADNGTAVAYMLALLDDKTLPHPPLECLFTVQEETGLIGAAQLDPAWLKARTLINLDGGPEGSAVTGCAGGLRAAITLKYDSEPCQGGGKKVFISGLQGGHSGVHIGDNRGNAIKLSGRFLYRLSAIGCRLADIAGGSKDNAIPRECSFTVSCPDNKKKEFDEIIKSGLVEIKKELGPRDPGVSITVEDCPLSSAATEKSTRRIAELLNLHPNGVQVSEEKTNFTIASLNTAVIEMNREAVVISSSIRSSIEALKYEIRDRLFMLAGMAGATITTGAEYPGWESDAVSPLRDLAASVYKEVIGKDFKTYQVHGGVECGVFKGKWPDMDMISTGCDSEGGHSPDENLDIPSFGRTWKFLLALLEKYCSK